MVFGRRRKDEEEQDDDDQEVELVLFKGALNGVEANLKANAKLVRAGLIPAKEVLSDAIARRAHEVVIEPRGGRALVRYMIDGIAYPGGALPAKRALAIVQVLKLLAGLDINERSQPQSGGIRAEFEEQSYFLLLDSIPLKPGIERLRVRIENEKKIILKPQDAGFSDELRKAIREMTTHQRGILLVCGPPGSGTTTTAYATLHTVDSYLYTVFSLAKPTYRELINVAEFQGEEEHDLKTTVDRILRKEANVIFLDPVEDPETAQLIFDYQEKVAFIAEFPGATPTEALQKLISWVGADKVATGLSGIITQKLIRKLCDDCKEAYRPNPRLLQKLNLPPETKVLYREPRPDEEDPEAPTVEELCEPCGGSPYHGRTGMFELLRVTDGMKEVILEGADPAAVKEQMKADDALTIQKDGLRHVLAGRTSLEELQRTLSPPRRKRPGRRR